MKSVVINVTGRVQGVGFRYYTKKKADSLDLVGNVRNNSDGSVSIKAMGSLSNIEFFVEWCKKGPLTSKVTGIHIDKISSLTDTEFKIIR